MNDKEVAARLKDELSRVLHNATVCKHQIVLDLYAGSQDVAKQFRKLSKGVIQTTCCILRLRRRIRRGFSHAVTRALSRSADNVQMSRLVQLAT